VENLDQVPGVGETRDFSDVGFDIVIHSYVALLTFRCVFMRAIFHGEEYIAIFELLIMEPVDVISVR
jgi:hypothetical protein